MIKDRYRVDLPELQAQCELNYARLERLLPRLGSLTACQFGLPEGPCTIEAEDQAPYTTTLNVHTPAWEMQIRASHDAKLAEVASFQGKRNFAARYDYPNETMMQIDEKRQLNRFLGDWLQHALKMAHSLENPLVNLFDGLEKGSKVNGTRS